MNSSLIQELISIVGRPWVLTDPGDVFVYSFDSALDRAIPSAVVLPSNAAELSQVIESLSRYKQPFVARGAATSLCGGPVALNNSVVVTLTRLRHIGKISPEKNEIVVGPGVINLKLQEVLKPHKVFFAPDPGSQKACTIGGNVATNAGGPHCLKYGVTSNNVVGLDVILPGGKTIHVGVNDPGYDMVSLFVGSEGTLGVVSSMVLKLLPQPSLIRTLVVSFPSIESAIQSVTDIIAAGMLPATLEAMDRTTVTAVEAFVHAGYPLDAEAVLLIEVDGDDAVELDSQIQQIKAISAQNGCTNTLFATTETERAKLWEGRRGAYAAMARLAPNVLVEDGAVPRTKLPQALKKIKEIANQADLQVALLFHAGDGNLHPQIIFDERDAQKTKIVKEAGHKMLKACVDLGGTISGEHGIGMDKREAMRWLFSRETLSLFRRIKNIFDPNNLCNPDKLIPLVVNSGEMPLAGAHALPAGLVSELGLAAPQNEDQIIQLVKEWAREKKPFGVQGSKSKYLVDENQVISTLSLNQITDFDRGNLTLTVQAGALAPAIRAVVEKEGQYLWVSGEGTLGGIIAARSSVIPPLRDLILGMRVLLPNGDVVCFGAKTMKNVAGYDAGKLLIGSWGTLGIILDVTFRLFATPPRASIPAPVQPFSMKDYHKKIKLAFDPLGLMSPRLSSLTDEELRRARDHSAPAPQHMSERGIKNTDQFWTNE